MLEISYENPPDNSVEDVAIIVTIPRVHAEILHSLWTLSGKQVQVDVPHSGVDGGILVQAWCSLLFSGGYDVFFAWLLVEHIPVIVYTAEIFAGPVGEHIESVFLVSSGDEGWICSQVSEGGVVRGLHLSGGGCAGHGLWSTLEQGQAKCPEMFSLTKKSGDSLGYCVDYFDTQEA